MAPSAPGLPARPAAPLQGSRRSPRLERAGVAPERFFYGGQAVIEGVMMRGRGHYAVAVRMPRTGEIVVRRGELTSGLYRHPAWRLPFARGVAQMAEMIHLGMTSLLWSAGINARGHDVEIGKREIAISLATALVFAVLLFFGLPLLGAGLVLHRSGTFGFVLVEGLIRVVLVIGYLWLIGQLRDVRRVFQFHGAEHKTINAYEADWPLDVRNVGRASLLHPRCGTGFLVVVVVASVIIFSLVAVAQPNWFWLVVSRLLAIPLIAGVGFEWIRFMARHRDNPVVAVMLVPVLATQRLTTREPDASQMEVAIAAFTAAREGEEAEPA
ncbi:MAG: DUF1385 domain-containing protein [Candidatus Dormibacterales bacterium]